MSVPAESVLGDGGPTARDVAFWGGAALAAALAHLAIVVGLYAAVPDDPGQEAFEEAMVVDLAPMPIAAPEAVAPDMLMEDSPEESLEPVEEVVEVTEAEPAPTVEPLPVDDLAPEEVTDDVTEPVTDPVEAASPLEPTVEPTESAETAETVEPEPVEQEVLEPEPVEQEVAEEQTAEPEAIEPEALEPVEAAEVVAVAPPELTQDVVEPEIVETEVYEAITPEVAIPLPQPKPDRHVEATPEPRKQPPPKRQAAKKQAPKQEARPAPKRKAAPKPKSEAPSVRSAQNSTARKISPARWHNQVRAAIQRRVGRVRGQRGTVRVQFVVSQSGSILSASVAGSSGDGDLDSAALRAVRQAQVPPPPEGIGGGRHAFTVPLTFK